MPPQTVCRVCLVDTLNLFDVRTELQQLYEQITGQEYNKVGYPVKMCYICLSVLRKSHKFMETAQGANSLLAQWDKHTDEMVKAKSLSTYSITCTLSNSMGSEDVSIDEDIKTENDHSSDELNIQTEIYSPNNACPEGTDLLLT